MDAPIVEEIEEDLSEELKTDASREVLSLDFSSYVVEVVKPELKPLPTNLKYAFLDDNEMYPVIVSASLSDDQLHALLVVLKRNKQALGYCLDDLKGISLDFCMH